MDSHERYASDYALPGGVERYFETLISMLSLVAEQPATYEVLSLFMVQRFAVSDQATTIGAYIGVVTRMGFWVAKDGTYTLTPEGKELVELASTDDAAARRKVFEIKIRDYEGYSQLMEQLCDRPATFDRLDKHLKSSLNVEWKSRNQTAFRLSWLRSLGYVERKGSDLAITEEGRSVYRSLRVDPIDPKPKPIIPPPQPRSSLLVAAENISAALEQAATSGGAGLEFEVAAASAFEFLGFGVQRIGGSGQTDVLVNARMGERSYQLIVETKSRNTGVVTQNDVNFPALEQHRVKTNADHVVVLAKDFSAGNLESFARQHSVRLLRIEELQQVLVAHAAAVISLDRLRDLFRQGGTTDGAALDEVLADSESSAQLTALCRDVFDAVLAHQDQEAILTEHSLFHVLRGVHTLLAIRATIELLRSSLVSAVGTTDQGGLYCRVSRRSLLDRLTQIKEVIGGVVEEASERNRN